MPRVTLTNMCLASKTVFLITLAIARNTRNTRNTPWALSN
jgi:hypothetical protein